MVIKESKHVCNNCKKYMCNETNYCYRCLEAISKNEPKRYILLQKLAWKRRLPKMVRIK